MGGGAPAQDTYAQDKQARISREQYALAKEIYDPLRKEFLKRINDPAFVSGARARGIKFAGSSAAVGAGVSDRNASRYGVTLNAQEKASQARTRALSTNKAKIGAGNTAAMLATNIKDRGISSAVAQGRGILSQANRGFADAASMESRRNQINQGLYAQEQSGYMQLAGTGLGLGLAFL